MQQQTEISLSPHFASFITQQVESGRYASPNDAVNAALKLWEQQEIKRAALEQALIEGKNSGHTTYSLEELIAELDAEEEGIE
jgi:antitoxin ParD1/3/4